MATYKFVVNAHYSSFSQDDFVCNLVKNLVTEL